MKPHYFDDSVTLFNGDCLDVLAELPDASVDAVVTDPPYGLDFMGKHWDTGAVAFNPTIWEHALRILKPGGHLVAFGGTRTWHRLACAIEDAGFEVRDSLAWLYGSGFSKSWNFATQFAGQWCECGENPVPLNHASNAPMFSVRNDVHTTAVPCGESQDASLFEEMQRSATRPGVGETRPQGPLGLETGERSSIPPEDAGRIESILAGRQLHRTRQGLPNDPQSESPASAGERLCGGTSAGDGANDRAPSDAARGSASHQSQPGRQSTGEPEAVRRPHESLDGGALRGCSTCPRCGGLRQEFKGFGSGLKPAHEPVVVARKPLAGTLAANVLAHRTGALNIDGCRVGAGGQLKWSAPRDTGYHGGSDTDGAVAEVNPAGRFPANVLLDETAAAELDKQSGITKDGVAVRHRGVKAGPGRDEGGYMQAKPAGTPDMGYGGEGGASRFFPVFRYTAKAPGAERPTANGIAHPTVKPLELMRWLIRLVTPPGGLVLDPFAGSGTTAEACLHEHKRCIVIEREADYLPLIMARLHKPMEIGFDFGEPA